MPTPVSPIRITVYIFFQLAFSIIRYRHLKKQIVYINISLSDVRPFCTNLTNIQRNKMTAATVSNQVNPSSLAPATDPFPFWEFVVGFCRLRFNKRLLASPSSPLEIYLGFSALFLSVQHTGCQKRTIIFVQCMVLWVNFTRNNGSRRWILQ